jgi:micrococcal nuclease
MPTKKKASGISNSVPKVNWARNATVVGGHDGDTIKVALDMGFGITNTHTLRFDGIDTPELNSKDPETVKRAIAAKEWIKNKAPVGTACIVETVKDKREKYGRYLARVWVGEVCVNDELVKLGLAKSYTGRGPK